jgi:hypothetical protein
VGVFKIVFRSSLLLLLPLTACSSSSSTSTARTDVPSIVSSPDCGTARDVAAVLSGADLANRAGIEALPGAVNQLSALVPSDLSADVNTLADAVQSFVGVLQRFDFDTAAADADPAAQAQLRALDKQSVVDATARIQKWLDQACA